MKNRYQDAQTKKRQLDIIEILGLSLIFCSSVLLGIWAVKNTIALRNFLLVIGSVASIFYLYRCYKNKCIKIEYKFFLPLVLIASMFVWVIINFLFFSRFPEIQVHEIKSTWMRSMLAVFFGMGAGIAIVRHQRFYFVIWLGILVSFCILFFQYSHKAILENSLFAPDYVNYIYIGKINGVLAGSILLAGITGSVLSLSSKSIGSLYLVLIGLWIFTVTLLLYSYVFIFDTKNGVGVAILLLIFTLPVSCMIVLKSKISIRKMLNLVGVSLFIMIFFSWITYEHIKHNPGWLGIWNDMKIAVQVERYPNWQNPQVMGYPKNDLGETVKSNTYERVAWGFAGLTIFLPENPYGIGTLNGPFAILLAEKYPNAGQNIPSTHSAWVEISLAYGYIGFALMLSTLISIFALAAKYQQPFSMSVLILSLTLAMLYMIGELSTQHAIEILYFMMACMSTMLMRRG